MRSTQKNPNKPEEKKGQWQIPERQQVFVTPGAQKSLEDAERRGEAPKIKTDRPPAPKAPPKAPAVGAAPTHQTQVRDSQPPQSQRQSAPQAPKKPIQNKPLPNNKKSEGPLSLKDAIIAEVKDRIRTLRLSIQVNAEDIIRGAICAGLMILFALLQTTFFVRFAPFGRVPDLMLVFVLAIGVYEGEKWGSITGLVAAFLIQALGSSGNGPELLSLIYMPIGCAAGLLSKYYLRHTLPVNAVYTAIAAFIRMIVTVITAAIVLDARFGDILLKIAIPEYFSTLLIAPIPFFSVWAAFRRFHKTRAERTDRRSEI